MNAGDMVRNSNSWHWLAAVVVLSAAGSVFVPEYGWKDVLAYRSGRLEPQVRKQAERLAELEALREGEAIQAQQQADETRNMVEKSKEDFAAYGFEAVPQGGDAVFAAQSRVSGALAKRRIRIVSSEASVKREPVVVPVKPPEDNRHPKKTVTAAEFKRQSEQAAAKIKDKKRIPPAFVAKPSFKTAEIDYKASGDFRDIFMFFVGETHVRANYAFKDIAVTARNGDAMDLSFTMLVNHR